MKQDGQERKEERMGTKTGRIEKRMEGREERKEKEETHLLLSFSLLQNLRKGNMLPAQKEKNVKLLCQLADDRSDHAVANPLIYAQHMDRTDQKKKAIPLLIEIREFLA